MSASALAASPIFKECAKVTVVYLGVYVGAVLYQLVAKVKAEIAVAKKISAAKVRRAYPRNQPSEKTEIPFPDRKTAPSSRPALTATTVTTPICASPTAPSAT